MVGWVYVYWPSLTENIKRIMPPFSIRPSQGTMKPRDGGAELHGAAFHTGVLLTRQHSPAPMLTGCDDVMWVSRKNS